METLDYLQESITRTTEAVEGRREAFFANPEDPHTIHRFRTNARALRSHVAFVKPWQNARQNTETQEILRKIVGHTSRLRELDVFERQARSNPDSSPELLALCKEEASCERAKTYKALSSKRLTKSFQKAMEASKDIAWKRRYAKDGLPANVVRARFDAMVESVGADLDALDLFDEERTHKVRKRAKRARYVAESNGELLGSDAVDIARGMEAHQDNLGDICDARVNIRLIDEFLQRDLPKVVVCELHLTRAQNEVFLYEALRSASMSPDAMIGFSSSRMKPRM